MDEHDRECIATKGQPVVFYVPKPLGERRKRTLEQYVEEMGFNAKIRLYPCEWWHQCLPHSIGDAAVIMELQLFNGQYEDRIHNLVCQGFRPAIEALKAMPHKDDASTGGKRSRHLKLISPAPERK